VGSQSFGITFNDGTKATVELKYSYLPSPFCTPRYIIFQKASTTLDLVLSFPGEDKIAIGKMSCPNFIRYAVLPNGRDEAGQIKLRFTCDRTGAANSPQGTIHLETSSKRLPAFGIPYLILNN
jgi:hypothetical protein